MFWVVFRRGIAQSLSHMHACTILHSSVAHIAWHVKQAMLQTQLSTGQLQWVSLSVGCMLASWFSAWFSIRSSEASGLPLRQATGQGTAPSIRHLCCSTSLTHTYATSLHYISALWTSNLHMTGCSGSCCGISFAGWGSKAPCWAPYSPCMMGACST